MKIRARNILTVFLMLWTGGCSAAPIEPTDRLLYWTLSPAIPIVLFEHCLSSKGIERTELEDGKIKGTFDMTFTSENAVPGVQDVAVNFSDTHGHESSILVSCGKIAAIAFNSLSVNAMAGASHFKRQKPFHLSEVFFPITNIDPISGTANQIELKQLEYRKGSVGRYLIKYRTHYRLPLLYPGIRDRLRSGVILELGEIKPDGTVDGRIIEYSK